MNNFTPMTIWSLLGIPPPNPYPKGTRVWYNMCSGGLMFATVDSTGRLPDGTILLTIINDDGERVTLPPSVPRPAPPPWLEPEAQASVERVSPPDPKEVHLDTALYQKKIDFRSLSPPPNFDMQTMQQEIRRLAHGQADLLQKLRDQQAQVSVMESSTPTMREYSAFVVRKQDIDTSALLPPAVDSPVTLSQRLLALEEITRCIQDQDLASRPLSEKIASLETSVWFQEEKITGATRRMDRIEESAHMRWKETQEDLQSIRSDHQRLEAEVREAVKTLENKWETTPAVLQESLTWGFEKLASHIETAELTLHDLTKSVTTILELNLRLSARQSSLESLIIQFLGSKEKKHTGINTDRSVSPDRGQKSQQVQVSPTPGVVLPNPVSTDHTQVSPTPAVFLPPASESPAVLLLAPNPIPPTRASSPGPYIGGNRKSPRLQKLEPTLQTPAQTSRVRLFEPDPFQHGRPIFTKFWTDTTTWDVRDYAADLSPRQSGSNEELEKKLLARFPPIYETAGSDIPYLDQPCHITDRQGHILLWYFPEMFSEQLRTFIWDHTGSLSPKKRSNGTWRDHHPENEGVTGIVNLSPSWFSQGHEGPEDPLRASADIQEPANSTYLQNVLLANAIVGTIYAVIQPDLFESGLATFEKLANHAEALDDPINIALRVWATPFTGLSVILNRKWPQLGMMWSMQLTWTWRLSEGGIDIEMAEVKHEETEVGAIPKADKDVGRVTPTIIIEPPTPHTSAIFKSTETEVGTNTDKGKGWEIGLPASEMEWIVPELAMRPELGLAVNYIQQSFTPPPVECTSWPEGSRLVSRSRQVSPPDPKEVHLDTALYQKKIDFRSLSPPPNFDMQTMQQEIRRLAHGQADLLQKLRDQQAQVSVMESSTPTMREYSAFVVRKQDIDTSALLPPAVDSPVTLSQRLLALEEITRCIQDQDLASRPLSEKIASLETSVWFQEEKITGATRRMDRIEESAHMRWKETQEDLQSIRSDHQRLEAEVREAVKTLENKWETTPAVLQESLTWGFEKLASHIETAELTLHDLTKSVTTILELNLRLSARQSSLESLIIQFLGSKEKKHTGINTDRSVSPDRGQKSQQVQVSPTPGVVLPNPVSTDHTQVSPTPAVFLPPASESPAVLLLAPNPIPPTRASSPGPYIGGNRKSPRLQKLEPTLQTPAQTECGCLSQTRSNMVMDPVNCMTEYWTMTGKEKPSVNWMGPGWADPRCMGFKALQQTHDT
ncbi:uncharacterized protein LACBIDRAFT_323739 [Laccaria bicolor S238N-H82]|uniref:Predicted protein n=1 Tax=Laccaria bicolor (strain S238N-H82 / ATCC MYA-4686) TaxID=486041 RepID=B0CYM2_LACBS|nr:uncharacterized protein LACBIDRAFT_323739 [Laccaria bicolor S238N-H82]EDR12909.1 predicted protein [Laccaria bicolor S238N-H82]|eukprot:XP_001877173.1 predicted protein [Laccaria bicolor S238N-H82]